MGFYNELSNVYDIVFKKEEKTLNFLKNGLSSNSNILDLACGTGTYAIELSKEGHNVIGIDLDKEMIIKAEEKKNNTSVEFKSADMRGFRVLSGKENFDMIYCIGNSLVHLESRAEVSEFLRNIYESLKKDGYMVIQIINYDRILNKGVTSLPTIDRKEEGIEFVRNYALSENKDKVFFQTKLIISKDNVKKEFENSVPLLALRSSEVIEMLANTGFSNYEVYGGFDRSEYNEDSYALVIKAIK